MVDVNNSSLIDHRMGDVLSVNYYYPIGMGMPGREVNEGYRYGFNGKEQGPEVSGNGNMYDYGVSVYNPKIGKFLRVDPLMKSCPWYTLYQFAGNKPIWAMDLGGLEEMKANYVAHEIKDVNGNIITTPTVSRASGFYICNIPGVRKIDDNMLKLLPGLWERNMIF